MRIYTILLIFCISIHSHAYLTSDFDANWGFTSLTATAGDSFSRRLESFSTIEFSYNLNVSSLDLALGISFQEFISDNFGPLPFTRIAITPRWYPRGLNGSKVILDNQVLSRSWSPAPFIGLSIGMSNLSFEEEETSNSYNAVLVDAMLRLGVEIPITNNWLLIGQFGAVSSLVGSSNEDQLEIKYSGIQMLVGLKNAQF